ncbi:MAG: formylglycine-generating enzyme family protein [Chitinispirillales bacterium]|nr:formylglycine-generating enzyme family protein [Chitinispirillales bacterium]
MLPKRLVAVILLVFLVQTVFSVNGQQVVAPAEEMPEIDMVFVKGGRFRMGCPGEGVGCLTDERPIHEVRLNDFQIGKYQVTQRQWKAVMGTSPAHFNDDDNRPVEQVSWDDIQEFIAKLNAMTGRAYRLPTEAEWEYAALGGAEGGARFSGHRFFDDIAWYAGNSRGQTQLVGGKQPNELGIHDMLGNVWEWVNDRYDRYYYRQSPLRNPRGPRHGVERVYRGCSIRSAEDHCRPSIRNFNRPDYRALDLGFRLAHQ